MTARKRPKHQKENPGMIDGWMTLPTAADQAGVSRGRLQQAASRGALPARKLGTGETAPWLVRYEDVQAFLKSPGARRGPKRKRAN